MAALPPEPWSSVAVIGAHVTGLTTAYELLDRGFEVMVFDRHLYAAMETSFDKGGIDFDLERRGILHFYSEQKDLAHARMVNGLLAEGGLDRRELSPAEMRGRAGAAR